MHDYFGFQKSAVQLYYNQLINGIVSVCKKWLMLLVKFVVSQTAADV